MDQENLRPSEILMISGLMAKNNLCEYLCEFDPFVRTVFFSVFFSPCFHCNYSFTHRRKDLNIGLRSSVIVLTNYFYFVFLFYVGPPKGAIH